MPRTSKHVWTEEGIRSVSEMRRDGMTFAQIAQKLGVSKDAVGNLCRKHGITKKPEPNGVRPFAWAFQCRRWRDAEKTYK